MHFFVGTVLAGTHGSTGVAVDLMLIMLVASVVATVFARLKLEAIPGYLVAGALVGPYALGWVGTSESVDRISQLAVVLLLFSIGLQLDAKAIGKGMVDIVAIGITSIAAFIAMVFPILIACGLTPGASLAIAMPLALSSTAVLVRVVGARRETRSVHFRVGLGVSIVQDLASVVMLAVLPFLAVGPIVAGPGESHPLLAAEWLDALPGWAEVIARAGIGLGGILVLILVAKLVLPAMLGWVSKSGSGELMLVFSGAVALAAAIGTSLLGFSAEMGAFLAGFLLASTPFRHQLAGQFAPVRDILMAVFFTAVGLQVNPHVLMSGWDVVLVGCVLLVGLKVLTIWASGWAFGLSPRSSWLTAVYLGNAGEFALVVIGAATALGVLSDTQTGLTIAVVLGSLVVSPMLIGPSHRLSSRVARIPLAPWIRTSVLREAEPGTPAGDAGHEEAAKVVIAGFGPVGRAIADRLEVAGVSIVIIELNVNTVERQTKIGKRRVVYGDVTNTEVLESAGVSEAAAIILTVPDEPTVLRACKEARRLNPGAYIAVRTSFLSGMFQATQLGADHVTVEELATADVMQREVLAHLRKREIIPPASVGSGASEEPSISPVS
jgi:Kef-type K+ transport system membrane component KefB